MTKNNHIIDKQNNHLFHSKERKLVEGYRDLFILQLKDAPQFITGGGYGHQNKQWESLMTKKEFCEKLLG